MVPFNMSNLVFLDLETTGLKPSESNILEIGIVVVSTSDLRIVAEKNWVLWFPKDKIVDLDPVVQEMHAKNGLWDECAVAMAYHPEWYRMVLPGQIKNVLEDNNVELGATPMCGNSIHFDHRFLEYHFPNILKLFNHRLLDVSSLGNIAEFFPDYLERAQKGGAHRAIPECKSSIDQLKFYLDNIKKYKIY